MTGCSPSCSARARRVAGHCGPPGWPSWPARSPPRSERPAGQPGLAAAACRRWRPTASGCSRPTAVLRGSIIRPYRCCLSTRSWPGCTRRTAGVAGHLGSGGRFRPEYVVGGVVSGRWASRGGGALQIPKLLRQAVVADPGWTLVVADAASWNPACWPRSPATGLRAGRRGRRRVRAVAGAFGGDRAKAKVALLSAMYGGAGGDGGAAAGAAPPALPAGPGTWRRRPGGRGRPGRPVGARPHCPPPSAAWRAVTGEPAIRTRAGSGCRPGARARGRFTRNSWSRPARRTGRWSCWRCAPLRQLAGRDWPAAGRARSLVFFQHDEVIVHCPADWPTTSWRQSGRPRRRDPAGLRRDGGELPDDDRSRRLLRRRQVSCAASGPLAGATRQWPRAARCRSTCTWSR